MTDDEKQARALVAELVAIRKRKKLFQRDIAEQMHMTRSAMSHFENHTRNPKLITVLRYARVVGADLIVWQKLDGIVRLKAAEVVEGDLKIEGEIITDAPVASQRVEAEFEKRIGR